MENETYDCSDDTIRLTIEELGERWQWLYWERGAERLHIVERFSNVRSFTVRGLSMDIEDDCCYCGDYNNTLRDHFSVLIAFLKKSVKSILLLPLGNDLYQEQITFDDGEVLIEIVE